MAEINKPSIGVAWAETGSKVEPTDTKKNTGWVVEKPPYEWWNFIEHRQDKMLQHINQHGIAVWDSATEYVANKSYVLGSNGDIYRAVADSVGVNPVGDTSNNWFRVLDNYYLKGEIDSFIAATILPVGAVLFFAMNTSPSGYLVCNGSAVSRTAFATLFARIGTVYGDGDGSTTFNLPDLRGEFIRGFDSGRGIDSGRAFGSGQLDEIKAHTHPEEIRDLITGTTYLGGIVRTSGGNVAIGSTGSSGGNETRPRNIAMLPCIKV